MFLDDDFACRFADEEEEEEKRKRVCDWETEEIEDSAIRCIMNLYIYIYILFVRVCFLRRVSPRMRLFLFPRAEGNPGFRYSDRLVTNKQESQI